MTSLDSITWDCFLRRRLQLAGLLWLCHLVRRGMLDVTPARQVSGRLGKARIERAVWIFREIGSVETNVDAVSAVSFSSEILSVSVLAARETTRAINSV